MVAMHKPAEWIRPYQSNSAEALYRVVERLLEMITLRKATLRGLRNL